MSDVVNVKVARVDLDKREIDFVLTDALIEKRIKKKKQSFL
jgi:hypothetical protein